MDKWTCDICGEEVSRSEIRPRLMRNPGRFVMVCLACRCQSDEYCPCNPDIFAAAYDRVSPPGPMEKTRLAGHDYREDRE